MKATKQAAKTRTEVPAGESAHFSWYCSSSSWE
eukprot:CAMPEP_0178449270 /NCGR_PEP_ID=MMETSP0689_2-20121128/42450_1 /TAXON_ID=160604 /ORGANISM="Amphidinium massartii, Strain CS-259" /LENGTH=32 /DNA_ID= /DNA_START= /DNA_END= /DNA_ORIENTATION=